MKLGDRITISVPPANAAEAVAREAYVKALADVRRRERKDRPVWLRWMYWVAVWRYARGLSRSEVEKLEYDEAFPK